MFDTIVCFSPVLILCFSLKFKIFSCKKKISIFTGKIFVFYRKSISPLREKYLSNLHLSFFRGQLLDDVVKLCINARSSTTALHCIKVPKSSIEAIPCEALCPHLWSSLGKTMHS